MHRHILPLLAVASFVSSLPAQSARSASSAPSDTIAYTTANVRVREQPLPNTKELAFLATGASMRLHECSEGWCRVTVRKITGYALQEYLTTRSVSALPRDTVVYAVADLRVRQQPAPRAKELALLGAGTSLRLHECAEGWCSVTIKKVRGYALEEYLTTHAPFGTSQVLTAPTTSTTSQGRGYTNSQGNPVASPSKSVDGRPPAGATAKCNDGTFSFSQSRRGTCSHHGGVAQWLVSVP